VESPRSAIIKQSASVTAAVAPFGVAFGVATQQAGMHLIEAIGFSALVFSGSAQFAAVSVLGDGGSVSAAVVAGLLLNLRSVAFGVAMAPALKGRLWWRALVSQLMIDEATAVGASQSDLQWRRYGYLVTGLGVFLVWNLTTIAGASIVGSADGMVQTLGIDATIPAAFLALVWPRLSFGPQRLVACGGAIIAFVAAPVLPAGLHIAAAGAAVLVLRPWRRSTDERQSASAPNQHEAS